MTAESVLEAIKMAQERRNIKKPVIIHSDREIQFTSELYKEITKKREWLNQYKIQNYNDAYKVIFEYIETFYNTVRIHSLCNYQSPNQYERNYAKNG